MGAGTRASEDCLFLNVWAPSGSVAGAGLPVLVWVHGGAYIFGSGSQPLYDARALVSGAADSGDGGVVVVTLNYRMGALGFLELGGFDAGDRRFDSNLGLRDVLRALQWVQENIAAFGGDPAQVTLFGESAGGGIVTTLLTSPAAAGLFGRAIAQSSPATSVYDAARAHTVAELLLKRLGVTAAQAMSTPVEALVDASTHVFDHIPSTAPGTLAFAPIVDGDLVPDYPVKLAREGRSLPVPLIVGTNRDEASLFRFMKSPLMPIAPKAIRTMFSELAAEQPGLVLPTRDQVGSAYADVRTRAWACTSPATSASGCRPCGWPKDTVPSRRCTCTASTGPPRCSASCGSGRRTPPNCLMSGAIWWPARVMSPSNWAVSNRAWHCLGAAAHRWLNFARGAQPDGFRDDPAWPATPPPNVPPWSSTGTTPS